MKSVLMKRQLSGMEGKKYADLHVIGEMEVRIKFGEGERGILSPVREAGGRLSALPRFF